MQTFRFHGLPPAEPARAPAGFGRRSPRRYGCSQPGVQEAAPGSARGGPDDAHGDAPDAPRWVDQDFEEVVFE
jgi:hypothetical protein